ncbi:MAG: hypothetical protein RIQ89_1749 [Bacteroidota bacterium]|jgi:hypothetical protein
MRLVKVLVIFLLFLLPFQLEGRAYAIIIQHHEQNNAAARKIADEIIDKKTPLVDTSQLKTIIKELHQGLLKHGFIAASIDSFTIGDTIITLQLFSGQPFQSFTINANGIDDYWLQGSGLRSNSINKKKINTSLLDKSIDAILKNCENKGFPFAVVTTKNVAINKDQVSVDLVLDKQKFIIMDSVIQRFNTVVAPAYLQNYLGIKNGDVYNELLISKITNRLKELPFLKEKVKHRILFNEKQTILELFLEAKKASQFDGVVGLLPRENEPGKYNLTGELRLRLQNSFKRAEIIDFNWRALPPRSQDLKARFIYPFILNLPIGIDAALNVYKRDTLFLDVIQNLGIIYQLKGNNYLKGFVNVKESSLLSPKALRNSSSLPPYADIKTTGYGLSFNLENLDYRINPSSGFIINTTATVGNRKISKNKEVNPVLYDSLQLLSTNYIAELKFDFFTPIKGRNIFNFSVNAAYQYQEVNTFENEYFRIGGLKSLRGFDEESIFASSYLISTLSYRFLLEQNSYFTLFFNKAWYERKSLNATVNDAPYGLGTGVAFETKLGILSVNYALGSQQGNPIQFRNSKVHFGVINYF